MIDIFKKNKFFFFPYLAFLFFSFLVMTLWTKAEIHLAINHLHTPFLDRFFALYTNMGDDIMVIAVSLILFFVRYRLAILLSISNILASIISTYLKLYSPIAHSPRPSTYFEMTFHGSQTLYTVPGVELYSSNSFPSGHTQAGFILFFFFATLIAPKRGAANWAKFLCFVMAFLVGYSRIYLSEHFLRDVVGGSISGLLSFMIISVYVNKLDKKWLDRSILSRAKKVEQSNLVQQH